MARTSCPACGAPMDYTGDRETVRCGFCGTDLRVIEEDGFQRFEVLAQPGPQKEVLSHPVEPAGQAQVFGFEPNPPENAPVVVPGVMHESRWSGVEVVPEAAVPPPPDPFRMESTLPPPPVVGAPAGPDMVRRTGSPGRWIAIGLAALLVLCATCACAAALIFAQTGGQFNF